MCTLARLWMGIFDRRQHLEFPFNLAFLITIMIDGLPEKIIKETVGKTRGEHTSQIRKSQYNSHSGTSLSIWRRVRRCPGEIVTGQDVDTSGDEERSKVLSAGRDWTQLK